MLKRESLTGGVADGSHGMIVPASQGSLNPDSGVNPVGWVVTMQTFTFPRTGRALIAEFRTLNPMGWEDRVCVRRD